MFDSIFMMEIHTSAAQIMLIMLTDIQMFTLNCLDARKTMFELWNVFPIGKTHFKLAKSVSSKHKMFQ